MIGERAIAAASSPFWRSVATIQEGVWRGVTSFLPPPFAHVISSYLTTINAFLIMIKKMLSFFKLSAKIMAN